MNTVTKRLKYMIIQKILNYNTNKHMTDKSEVFQKLHIPTESTNFDTLKLSFII